MRRNQKSRRGLDRLSVVGRVRVRTRYQNRIVDEYRGRNIFLNTGRNWLLQQISLDAHPIVVGDPVPAPAVNRRVALMGVGVGGREQTEKVQAAVIIALIAPPVLAPTFLQDDTDVTVTGLEAPIPIAAGVYAKPIDIISYSVAPYVWVKYTALWAPGQITFLGSPVPISEAAIYPFLEDGGGLVKEMDRDEMTLHAAAYEAFVPISVLPAYELEIQWTWRI